MTFQGTGQVFGTGGSGGGSREEAGGSKLSTEGTGWRVGLGDRSHWPFLPTPLSPGPIGETTVGSLAPWCFSFLVLKREL